MSTTSHTLFHNRNPTEISTDFLMTNSVFKKYGTMKYGLKSPTTKTSKISLQLDFTNQNSCPLHVIKISLKITDTTIVNDGEIIFISKRKKFGKTQLFCSTTFSSSQVQVISTTVQSQLHRQRGLEIFKSFQF